MAVVDLHSGGGELHTVEPTYISQNAFIDTTAPVQIGQHTIISDGVVIYTHEHGHARGTPQALQPIKSSGLFIEGDVYIGARAMILAGCNSIGKGAVIGACAVIAKDVPEYAIMAGNPAVQIGERK